MATDATAGRMGFRDVLVLGVWGALVPGVIEGAITTARMEWGRGVFAVSPATLWMTPLMAVVAILPFAALLGLAIRSGPLRLAPWMVLAALGTPAMISIGLTFSRLHPLAAVLLGIGASLQLSRLLGTRVARALPVLRRGLVPLLVITASALLVSAKVADWREGRRIDGLPLARAGAPNVLLLVLDTVRQRNLQAYGYPRADTPVMLQLAAQGALFRQAFSTAPWTLPSHASIFTGRPPHELSASWTSALDATYPTLAETLERQGYATAGFVANLQYCSRHHGLNRGFDHYEDIVASPGEILLSWTLSRKISERPRLRRWIGYFDIPGHRGAGAIAQRVTTWLRGRPARPFFVFVNFYDAHEPRLPPPAFDSLFASARPRRFDRMRYFFRDGSMTGKKDLPAADIAREVDSYDAAIAYLDRTIGLLLDSLRADGALDNTLLIVTSDHGEQFGESNEFDHGSTLNPAVIEIPLIMRLPGVIPAGRVVETPVSLIDLAATVGEVTGVSPFPLPGHSLAALWHGEPAQISPVRAEVQRVDGSRLFAALDHDDLYIRGPREQEQWYNLAADPRAERNLASAPTDSARLSALRALVSEANGATP